MSRGRYYSLLLHAFFVQVNCGKTQILNDVSMELYKNTSGMFGPKWEHEFVWGGGGVFPLQFRVLPNFHKCFYLTIRQLVLVSMSKSATRWSRVEYRSYLQEIFIYQYLQETFIYQYLQEIFIYQYLQEIFIYQYLQETRASCLIVLV